VGSVRNLADPVAVRQALPGTDLDGQPVGLGVLVWLRADDAKALHDTLGLALY
jgi:hypothetical protein